MMRELSASSISPVLPLVSSKSVHSEGTDSSVPTTLSPIRSHFADKSVDQYLWLIQGSRVDAISLDVNCVSNQRFFGSIDFSQVFNDNNIKILNVLQLMDSFESISVNSKFIYTLVVALRRGSGASILCLIDIRLSLVLKTIETPFKITSLEIITSSKANNWNDWPLIEELLHMNGILAVGTEGGLVFLLDLFLDNPTPLSEALVPMKISFIVCNSSHLNIGAKRRTASLHDQLICLPLNSDSHHKNKFVYKADDGTALSAFPKSQVSVSAVQYVPQTAMLCIGFDFGGFQFYSLKTFRLECSCALEYGLAPVVRFAFQDPENDPKNHSYVWVIRGQEIEDNCESGLDSSQKYFSSVSNAIMYSISFDTKEWIPNYGILYTGFQGCSCRFEYILGPNPHFPDSCISASSRLIDCYTIPLGNYSSHKSSDDESVNLDLSLLFIAWEALSDSSESNSLTYFAIFDLNQWYRSQMPTDVKTSEDKTFSPFLGVFSLVDIANSMAPDAILSVQMNRDSITKFRSQAFQDDIHYFPSSLSFGITILSESQICTASYLGLPKRCLALMSGRGSSLLIDPKDYVNRCVTSGLLPNDLMQTSLSLQLLRQTILTVALENECLPFLMQVIKDWSSGELTNCGCDSKFILEWIWKRVSTIKTEIDSITYPLFTFSGQLLDNFNLSQLYAYECDLKSLNILLRELQTSGAPTTQQGMQELALRREVTQLIALYLRILLWLYDCNLLPEHSEEEAYGEREVAYPSTQFRQYYTQRRTDLQAINASLIRPTDLLLIDGIVDSFNPGLSSLWIKGGGDGLYPPPNLHSLIGVFLLESVSLVQKQALMLYSLLDLADFLSDRQSDVVEKIRLFPSVFGLKPGLTKMIQAFWGLDHKLFDFSLEFLLDPVVKPLVLGHKDNEAFVCNDLQQRIVTSFLYQDQVRSALIYSQNCGQFALDTPEREKLHLNMLLVNGQISNAFHYQRLCRNESNATELLYHLFQCCEKMGTIEKIFKIPLDQFEEEVLTDYLLTSETPNAKHILVLYLIVNNKIIDSSNVLNEFKAEFTDISNRELAQKSQQLIHLINAYVSALPQSLTNLAKEITAIEEKRSKSLPKITISDTVPIQVKAKPLAYDWIAPSKVIENIMEQIADIWKREHIKPSNASTPLAQTKRSASKMFLSRNSPFLRTPVADIGAKQSKQSSKTVYPTPKLIDFDSEKTVKHKSRLTADVSRVSSADRKGKTKSPENDFLSVLSTPQIKRKSVAKSKADIELSSVSTHYFTPTSILKVKQMMRRSTSPASLASSPVPNRTASHKTLESTPLQHKLRFSVPDNSFTEDSVENARLGSIKDTLMLKTLKTQSQPIAETDEDSNLIDLSTTMEVEGDRQTTLSDAMDASEETKHKQTEELRSGFVFSPPQTRSSARKGQQSVKTSETEQRVETSADSGQTYQFSALEEKKKIHKQKESKEKQKKEKSEQKTEPEEMLVLETDQQLAPEYKERRSVSRSSTPTSYADDSDAHKSDTSQVSSSKASTRSSRSSRTPTKKNPKKVSETPTHKMKLRASTTKTKPKKDN